MRVTLHLALLPVLAATLASCALNKEPEETNLRSDWAKKLKPYGLTAIFPPRSTVQPGDVFLLCEESESSEKQDSADQRKFKQKGEDGFNTFEPRQLLSLPRYRKAVAAYFSTRLSLPHSATVVDSKSAVSDIPTNDEGIDARTRTWNRLGLSSFPRVFQVDGVVADGGVSAAAGSTLFGFSGSRRSMSTYVLSMPSSEWAGLPAVPAMQAANYGLTHLTKDQRAAMFRVWKKATEDYPSCRNVRILYASEVYYSRHLTLSYGESKAAAFAGQAALYLPPESQRANTINALKSSSSDQPASGTTAPGLSEAAAAVEAQRQAAVASALASVKLGTPSARTVVSSEFGNSVSFDYIFAIPVAVGAVFVELFAEQPNAADLMKAEEIITTSTNPSPGLPNWKDQAFSGELELGAEEKLALQRQFAPRVYVPPAARIKCGISDLGCSGNSSPNAITENTERNGFIRGLVSGPIAVVSDPKQAQAQASFSLSASIMGKKETSANAMTCWGSATVTWAGGKLTLPVRYTEDEVPTVALQRGKPSIKDLFLGRCGEQLGKLIAQGIADVQLTE